MSEMSQTFQYVRPLRHFHSALRTSRSDWECWIVASSRTINRSPTTPTMSWKSLGAAKGAFDKYRVEINNRLTTFEENAGDRLAQGVKIEDMVAVLQKEMQDATAGIKDAFEAIEAWNQPLFGASQAISQADSPEMRQLAEAISGMLLRVWRRSSWAAGPRRELDIRFPKV
jgi:hypothetical protein